jgi:hypothetical protein
MSENAGGGHLQTPLSLKTTALAIRETALVSLRAGAYITPFERQQKWLRAVCRIRSGYKDLARDAEIAT